MIVKSVLGVAPPRAALYYLQNVSLLLARYASARAWFAALNAGLLVLGVIAGGVHGSFHHGCAALCAMGLGLSSSPRHLG